MDVKYKGLLTHNIVGKRLAQFLNELASFITLFSHTLSLTHTFHIIIHLIYTFFHRFLFFYFYNILLDFLLILKRFVNNFIIQRIHNSDV